MIGNDIVDILASRQESNWQRKGFLDKLFTTKEITFIQENNDPELMVWLIWSAKESVYKIINRAQRKMFFAPKKFEFISHHFINDGAVSGVINYGNILYNFNSKITGPCIHTTAVSVACEISYFSYEFELLNADLQTQQTQVREEITNWYLQKMEFREELIVGKNESGIPYLYAGGLQLETCFSMSHHGGFGGFAVCLD